MRSYERSPTNKLNHQAYSPALPVGAQHYYKNSFDALRTIWRAEKFRGIIRGMDAAILRTSMGSSVSWLLLYRDMMHQLTRS